MTIKKSLTNIAKAADFALVPTSFLRYVNIPFELKGGFNLSQEKHNTNPPRGWKEKFTLETLSRLVVHGTTLTYELGRIYAYAYEYCKNLFSLFYHSSSPADLVYFITPFYNCNCLSAFSENHSIIPKEKRRCYH